MDRKVEAQILGLEMPTGCIRPRPSLAIGRGSIMSNVAGPSSGRPSQHYNSSSKPSNRSRYQTNLKKYGTPLPILLPCSPLHPSYTPPSKKAQSYLSTFLSIFEAPVRVEVPSCVGIYDPVTRSVWVTDRKDMEILFNRGFFGKGTLSRSEPTWRARRVDQARGGECELLTSYYVEIDAQLYRSCRSGEDPRETTIGTQAIQD